MGVPDCGEATLSLECLLSLDGTVTTRNDLALLGTLLATSKDGSGFALKDPL